MLYLNNWLLLLQFEDCNIATLTKLLDDHRDRNGGGEKWPGTFILTAEITRPGPGTLGLMDYFTVPDTIVPRWCPSVPVPAKLCAALATAQVVNS